MGWRVLRWVRLLGLIGILGGVIYLYTLSKRPSPLRILVVVEAVEGFEGGAEVTSGLRRALNAALSEAGFEVVSRAAAGGLEPDAPAPEVAARLGALFWLEARLEREYQGLSPDGREAQVRVLGALKIGAAGRAPLESELEGNGRYHLNTVTALTNIAIHRSEMLAIESIFTEVVADIYPYMTKNQQLGCNYDKKSKKLSDFKKTSEQIEAERSESERHRLDVLKYANKLQSIYSKLQVHAQESLIFGRLTSGIILKPVHQNYPISIDSKHQEFSIRTNSIYTLEGNHIDFIGWRNYPIKDVAFSKDHDILVIIEGVRGSRSNLDSYISVVKGFKKSSFKYLGCGQFNHVSISLDGEKMAISRTRLNFDKLIENSRNHRCLNRRRPCGNRERLIDKSKDREILIFDIESGEILWTRPGGPEHLWVSKDDLLLFNDFYTIENIINYLALFEKGIPIELSFIAHPKILSKAKAFIMWSKNKGERFLSLSSFEHYVELLGAQKGVVVFKQKDKFIRKKADVCVKKLDLDQTKCFEVPYDSDDFDINENAIVFRFKDEENHHGIGLIDLNCKSNKFTRVIQDLFNISNPKILNNKVFFEINWRESLQHKPITLIASMPIR